MQITAESANWSWMLSLIEIKKVICCLVVYPTEQYLNNYSKSLRMNETNIFSHHPNELIRFELHEMSATQKARVSKYNNELGSPVNTLSDTDNTSYPKDEEKVNDSSTSGFYNKK